MSFVSHPLARLTFQKTAGKLRLISTKFLRVDEIGKTYNAPKLQQVGRRIFGDFASHCDDMLLRQAGNPNAGGERDRFHYCFHSWLFYSAAIVPIARFSRPPSSMMNSAISATPLPAFRLVK